MKAEALLGRLAALRPTRRSPGPRPATCVAAPATRKSSRPSRLSRRSDGAPRPIGVRPTAAGVGERVERYDGASAVLGEYAFVGDMT